MYLDKILGSETKINMLNALVSKPSQKFVEAKLAEEIKMAASGVNRQIKPLVECGVVKMEKIGKANIYRINTEHFIYPALKKLFVDLNEVYKKMAMDITRHITKKERVNAVILIGSAKKGGVSQDYVGQPSDLDLVVVGEKPKALLDSIVAYTSHRLFEKYGINCYPIVMTEREYKKRLKKNDPFILEVQVGGEVLYGKKPSRLG